MEFDFQENISNANARKMESYCDLGLVIPYIIGSLGSWSNDNYILKKLRDTQKNFERIENN